MLESFKEIAERLGKVHGEWRWVKREKEILETLSRWMLTFLTGLFWGFRTGGSLWFLKAHLCSQLCLTLCDPWTLIPPDSSVHVIFQARILEGVAISYSRVSSHPGIEGTFPALSGRVFTTEPPEKAFSRVQRHCVVFSSFFDWG